MKGKVSIGLIENEEGVELRYVEEYGKVFMSPIKVRTQFKDWVEAANFLKMWSMLAHIKWW